MQTYCSSHTGIISREHTHAHELQIYYEITNPHNIKATQFIHKSKPTIWPPTNTHCSNLQSSLTHTHTDDNDWCLFVRTSVRWRSDCFDIGHIRSAPLKLCLTACLICAQCLLDETSVCSKIMMWGYIHSAHLYVKSRSHIFNLKEESTKQWLQCRRSSASSFNIFSSEHRKWCVTFLVCLENKQNKIFVSNLKYYLLYKVWVKWNFLHHVYTFNSRLADLSNIFLEATRCHFSLWVSWHCGSLVGIK